MASSKTPAGVKVKVGWGQNVEVSTVMPPLAAKKDCSRVQGGKKGLARDSEDRLLEVREWIDWDDTIVSEWVSELE